MTTASRDLELLVAKIQKQLAPQADVLHNVKLPGRITKIDRQIDVLMRQKIAQFDFNIVIECKDYKRPVDVKGVEAFLGLLNDVGAQKGVLVCPKGFTAAAQTLAKERQLDLYSPIDTDAHKWQATVTVSALCDYRRAVMNFRISREWGPLVARPNFHKTDQVYDKDGFALGTALEAASAKWHAGQYPVAPGRHEWLKIFDTETTLVEDYRGDISLGRIAVDLSVSVVVMKQLYYGQLSVRHMSGFRDLLSGKVITDAFTVGMVSSKEVETTWLKINDESEAPLPPVIVLPGLVTSTEEDARAAQIAHERSDSMGTRNDPGTLS